MRICGMAGSQQVKFKSCSIHLDNFINRMIHVNSCMGQKRNDAWSTEVVEPPDAIHAIPPQSSRGRHLLIYYSPLFQTWQFWCKLQQTWQLVYTGILSWTWMVTHRALLRKTLRTARGSARKMTSVMSSFTIQGNQWDGSQLISRWEYHEVP